MNEFDKIIGYADIKKELEQLADILRGNEAYTKLGVKIPRGLLLHGEPGLGKTLMATCLIKASGRMVFTCRKDLPNGEFVKAIRQTFCKAQNATPSIVFLDDMDKFANGDVRHPDAEEYVTVQSCIDSVKGHDVFVLATANNIHALPDSLLRVGRFDREIEVEAPSGEDAEEIIGHYTKDLALAPDIDRNLIARMLTECSCAELETVINEAGLYAGFERSDKITAEHFLKACLKIGHDVSAYAVNRIGKNVSDASKRQVAYHEAGHAVISEVTAPGSVSLVTVYKQHENAPFSGFMSVADEKGVAPLEYRGNKIMIALAGKAAVEIALGLQDVGAVGDVHRAFRLVGRLFRDSCTQGFRYYGDGDNSERLKYEQELAIAAEVEKYYRRTVRILAENRKLLDRLAEELMTKDILSFCDIKRIKEGLIRESEVA